MKVRRDPWQSVSLCTTSLPLTALLISGALWLVARLTRDAWQPVWSELTCGLPLIGDLAIARH
ncbi:MAG: hypothetical protein RMJ55_04435 [Roseiflexaceae bacterium]|nr:hypothetical protein [Roseiflexaceae bacterium]